MIRALVLTIAVTTATAAQARTTAGVVPLTTASTDEYQWIGPALAGALNMRMALQPELNALTGRQINAAMRQDNIEPPALKDAASAVRLGRLLGADVIFIGSYEARWPDVSVNFTAVDVKSGKLRSTHSVIGDLDALVD